MPIISIIVPVYNVEKYLNKCINSILNQTFEDYELILVDDGSTDNSSRICDEYAKIDDRIKVIHKINGGLSSARNMGIENSCGEYIAFIDSDDYIHPQMIEILYNNIKMYQADISICNYENVKENEAYNKIIFKDFKLIDREIKEYTNIDALKELDNKNVLIFTIACNKLYKKQLFNNVRYKEGKIHEDEFIIHELLYYSSKIVYTNKKLYYYFMREGSITKSKYSISRIDLLDAHKERIRFFRNIVKDKDMVERAVFGYSKTFFRVYYRLKYEVEDSDKCLRALKREYESNLINILRNPYYTKKEKIIIIVFCINPKIYEIYLNRRMGENKCTKEIGQP